MGALAVPQQRLEKCIIASELLRIGLVHNQRPPSHIYAVGPFKLIHRVYSDAAICFSQQQTHFTTAMLGNRSIVELHC